MSSNPNHHQKTEAELKQKRLTEALRANLRRRKDQKRGRNDQQPDAGNLLDGGKPKDKDHG